MSVFVTAKTNKNGIFEAYRSESMVGSEDGVLRNYEFIKLLSSNLFDTHFPWKEIFNTRNGIYS